MNQKKRRADRAGTEEPPKTKEALLTALVEELFAPLAHQLRHRRAGIEDCRNAYDWLLDNGPGGTGQARRVYIAGDSAGGNLALTLSAWTRDGAARKPDAVVALSPVTTSDQADTEGLANELNTLWPNEITTTDLEADTTPIPQSP